MGISALKCHAQGQGHVKVAGQLNSERIKTHFMKECAVAAQQTKSHKQPRYVSESGRETSREHKAAKPNHARCRDLLGSQEVTLLIKRHL